MIDTLKVLFRYSVIPYSVFSGVPVWGVCAFEVTTGDATHLVWLVEAYLEEFFLYYTTCQ